MIACADPGLTAERRAVAEVVEHLGMLVSCRSDCWRPWSSEQPSLSTVEFGDFDAMVLLLSSLSASRANSVPGHESAQLVASPEGLHGDDPESRAFEELTKVAHDSMLASMIALRSGFPRARLPTFTTPLAFWTDVVEEAINGVLRGGMRPIIETAAEMYPNNEVLNRYRRQPQTISCPEDERARPKYEQCRLRGIPVFAFLIPKDGGGSKISPLARSWRYGLRSYETTNGLEDLRSKACRVLARWLSLQGLESNSTARFEEHRLSGGRSWTVWSASVIAVVLLVFMGREESTRDLGASNIAIAVHHVDRENPPVGSGGGPHEATTRVQALDELPITYDLSRDDIHRRESSQGSPSAQGRRSPPQGSLGPNPSRDHVLQTPSTEEEPGEPPRGGMAHSRVHSGGSVPGSGRPSSQGAPEEPLEEPQGPDDDIEADRQAPVCSVTIDETDLNERSLIAACPMLSVEDFHLETEFSFFAHCRDIDAVGIFWDRDCDGFHFLGLSRDPALCLDDVAWQGFVLKAVNQQHGSRDSVEAMFCRDGKEYSWEVGRGREGLGEDATVSVALDSGLDWTHILVEGPFESDDREQDVADVSHGGKFGIVLYTTDPSADLIGCLHEISMATLISRTDDGASGNPGHDGYESPRFASIDELEETGSEGVSGAWLVIPTPETCEPLGAWEVPMNAFSGE